MMLLKFKLTRLIGLIALPLVILQLTGCQMTPLTAAAREGDIAGMNRLLNEGAKVDEFPQGNWSATPLYWSLFNCQFDAAKFLLMKGANVNLTDSYGSAPLHLAVSCKNVEPSFIEAIIQKGADVNYKNTSDGFTSLHYAISSRSVGVSKLLIDKGADINAPDNKGTTPLILAVQKDALPVAKLLLERGADVNLFDKRKKNAMSYTKGIFTKKKEMIQLLQNTDGIKPVVKIAASIDTSPRERKTVEKSTSLSLEKQPRVVQVKEIKSDGRFIAYDNGTVLDTKTNLMWAARDNGRGINWANANSYCKNYRGGDYTDWRMPTWSELAGLYHSGKTQPTTLIYHTFSLHWASETRGSEAAYFMLSSGKLAWLEMEYDINTVALPVRFAK